MEKTDKLLTLGQRIKDARRAARMSQGALAKRVGMSQANLSELENDHYPSSTFVPRMAQELRVSSLWLADGRGPREVSAEVTAIHARHPDPAIAEAVALMELADDAGRQAALVGVRVALQIGAERKSVAPPKRGQQ